MLQFTKLFKSSISFDYLSISLISFKNRSEYLIFVKRVDLDFKNKPKQNLFSNDNKLCLNNQ